MSRTSSLGRPRTRSSARVTPEWLHGPRRVPPGAGGSGSSTGLTSSGKSWSISNGTASEYLGWGLAGGDVNGDGYADILVGAPTYDDQGKYPGRAYLFQPGPSLPPTHLENMAVSNPPRPASPTLAAMLPARAMWMATGAMTCSSESGTGRGEARHTWS